MPKAAPKAAPKSFQFSGGRSGQSTHPWQEWLEMALPTEERKATKAEQKDGLDEQEIKEGYFLQDGSVWKHNDQFLVGSINSKGEEMDEADYLVGQAHKDSPKTKANQFAYVLKLEGWKRGMECSTRVWTNPDDGDIGIVFRTGIPTPERAEELKALAKERRKVKAKAKTAVNGDTEEEEYEEEDA